MKSGWIKVSVALFFAGLLFPADGDINIGKVNFPRDFIHAGKDYGKGVYVVVLTAKEGVFYFNVLNAKDELLFEELAIVKPDPKTSNKKFKARHIKQLLRGEEYFRIKVAKPGELLLAYFLIKKESKETADRPEK